MNSQDILLLNIGIIVAFALWYWSSRKPQAPTQLNLKTEDSEPVLMEAEQPPVAVPSKKDYSKVTLNNLPAPEIKTTRDLSVIFIYNGHSWNAFEVLGVPAGAALRDVTDAYQIALRKAEKESHEFLTCAYQSILSQRSRL